MFWKMMSGIKTKTMNKKSKTRDRHKWHKSK